MTTQRRHKYGWLPDTPDARDWHGNLTAEERLVSLPQEVSLRDKMPPVYDQGDIGSCTANAVAAAVQYQQTKQGEIEGQVTPSRLFIYYNERALSGQTGIDSGALIRDGIKVLASCGAPPETDWPYITQKFTTKPPQQSYVDATQYKTLSYARPIRTLYYLRNVLAVGRPFVFGFQVYESFESDQVAQTGIMPLPQWGEQILGGHAVICIGYKEINNQLYFEVRNSWGPNWGDEGYFWMPAAFMLDTSFTSDFWDIKLES